jgi:hypothetical protein
VIANKRRMKNAAALVITISLVPLAGCGGGAQVAGAIPQPGAGAASAGVGSAGPRSGSLTALYNLDYSHGTITVFSIANGRAKETAKFRPGHGRPQGLASDAAGNIYTTLTEPHGKPCAACVEVFDNTGRLINRLDAPILPGAPGAPSLTDISVDASDNVYVSDYGQQAVYFFPHGKMTKNGPTIVVQNSQNAASVAAQPNGTNVLISGGCGFASVAPFTRIGKGKYSQGPCFGIGTIALIGGAADNEEEVMTPVDGVPGLVSVSSPSGGASFTTPDRTASISGVAFNNDASVAYVANHAKECVYAFARPANGWLSGTQPKLLATYKGFKSLDIIATPE